MKKVLIIEDEGVAARRLQKMVEAEGLDVIGHCKSNKELQAFLDKYPEPDLYLMDIHLSDGISFETLEEFTLESPIIFTTAYDQYAVKAFKQNSIDYLLKPIDKTELQNAIAKFRKTVKSSPEIDIQALSRLLISQQKEEKYRERIRVKIGDKLRSISIEEVTHFYSEQKITFVATDQKRAYPIDHSVEQIHKELNPKHFFRVNRSVIVQIDSIKEVISYSNSRLKIIIAGSESQEIVVARERVKEFKGWLG